MPDHSGEGFIDQHEKCVNTKNNKGLPENCCKIKHVCLKIESEHVGYEERKENNRHVDQKHQPAGQGVISENQKDTVL
jgi:hypothetical protein